MEAVIFGVPAVAVSLDLPEIRPNPAITHLRRAWRNAWRARCWCMGSQKIRCSISTCPACPMKRFGRRAHHAPGPARLIANELGAASRPTRQAYYWILAARRRRASPNKGSDFWGLVGLRLGDPGALRPDRSRIHDALAKWEWEGSDVELQPRLFHRLGHDGRGDDQRHALPTPG